MNILDKIIGEKAREVLEKEKKIPLSELSEKPLPEIRDFRKALTRPGLSVIAEVKRQSPSEGLIREDFNPALIAQSYEKNNAAAISVLTDGPFFGGSDVYPSQVKRVVGLPVLRKEFIIHPYQILESRILGADAILLIAGVLDRLELKDFIEQASELELDCLVEVHNREELEIALSANSQIIGINNRDLKTFHVDLFTSIHLKQSIPDSVVTVSESGIKNRDDIRRLQEAEFDAVLVGTSLMKEKDPGLALTGLLAG